MAAGSADHTRPTDATRESERAAASAAHDAPQTPTEEEARLADSNGVSEGVEERYKEMTDRGANAKGEGSVG